LLAQGALPLQLAAADAEAAACLLVAAAAANVVLPAVVGCWVYVVVSATS
jgi:hypothetical protein